MDPLPSLRWIYHSGTFGRQLTSARETGPTQIRRNRRPRCCRRPEMRAGKKPGGGLRTQTRMRPFPSHWALAFRTSDRCDGWSGAATIAWPLEWKGPTLLEQFRGRPRTQCGPYLTFQTGFVWTLWTNSLAKLSLKKNTSIAEVDPVMNRRSTQFHKLLKYLKPFKNIFLSSTSRNAKMRMMRSIWHSLKKERKVGLVG